MGFEIDFLPVGDEGKSGDAIALRFGNLFGHRSEQRVVVIDAGYQANGAEVVKHIRSLYGTTMIDLVVSTHPDADHVGGLLTVLEECQVSQLWMHRPWNHTDDIASLFRNPQVTDTGVRAALRRSLVGARDLETLAQRKGVQILEPFSGLSDQTNSLTVIGPSQAYYESLLPLFRGTPEPALDLSPLQRALEALRVAAGRVAESWGLETLSDDVETSAENNSSVILLLASDGQRLLFTSDAGIPALSQAAYLLSAVGVDPTSIGFLQVPHHGSKHNVGPTILDQLVGPKQTFDIKSKTALVSAAKDGEPDHPAKKVTNAFRRRGAVVYATQGGMVRHAYNAPDRRWPKSVPIPFYDQVED